MDKKEITGFEVGGGAATVLGALMVLFSDQIAFIVIAIGLSSMLFPLVNLLINYFESTQKSPIILDNENKKNYPNHTVLKWVLTIFCALVLSYIVIDIKYSSLSKASQKQCAS